MATIYIDKKLYEVKEGENLLKTCLGLGLDLPYFCWHPALHSVGACRQCAVKQFKDEHDTTGRIVMACLTPVENGMHISVDDPEAKRFRQGVIEWLMTNHPHDCPVCDEGGECHLQDMTVMTGHSYRRYRGKKRTFPHQDIGPLVTHEMNRCIACYRCTRFYNDYAGGRDFGAFASRNRVFFGRTAAGTLESPFAGNLAEVCPTGVFDDKTFSRHYTRKWDLRTAPSVCVHCGLGCNTIPGERYGSLRRIRNRYNGSVNGYFLCDRGRYGYAFVNGERRIREPRLRREKALGLYPVSAEEAVSAVAGILASARRVVGIGSPRASLEANFALRTLVGPDGFYAGVAEDEWKCLALAARLMQREGALAPSLSDIARCDAVLILGEDISNTAPMLHLQVLQSQRVAAVETAARFHIHEWDDTAVRVAAGGARSPLFIATTGATDLDGRATAVFRSAPAGLARTGMHAAHLIDESAPPVPDLGASASRFASDAASALVAAKRPVIITGPGSRDARVIEAAANIVCALRRAGKEAYFCLAAHECNSAGLALMADKALKRAVADAEAKDDAVAVILENDLYRCMDARTLERFFSAFRHVIAIDHTFHRTLLRADAALPAATFAEGNGTFINNEGRAQRAFQVFPAQGDVRESRRWIKDVMDSMGRPESARWTDADGLLAHMAEALPIMAPAAGAAPSAYFRIAGMKVAREASRYSGRTAMDADREIHEPKPPADSDAPFAFSMEGYQGAPPPALIPRFRAPGWNSAQAVNKFQQEIAGALRGGDPGVRLFDASGQDGNTHYLTDVPEPFVPKDGLFLVVPFYHVFGSDETSVMTPEVRELAPQPYVALCERDMARLRVSNNDAAVVTVGGSSFRLAVRMHAELPPGVAAVAHGLPDAPVIEFPAWAEVKKAAT